MKIIQAVENVMLGELELNEAENLIHEALLKEINEKEKFKLRCAMRLLIRYRQYLRKAASVKDLLAALRNYILFVCCIRISPKLASEIEAHLDQFALELEPGHVLNGRIGIPSWFEQHQFVKAVFEMQLNDQHTSLSIGDGKLIAATGYTHYRSFEQKLAVNAAVKLPAGYTMAICLPTGGGKSLVTQMLATTDTGLTVVVVPTVALAIDQTKAAKKSLRGLENSIEFYIGGLDSERVNLIKESFDAKSLRLLFTSPEALIKNPWLNEKVMRAAESGYLKNLVIDEAHIVAEWGDQFRPDFQYLTVFRRRLIACGAVKLRTYLLSATFTEYSIALLKKLFAQDEKWLEIRGDTLRKEPKYCFIECQGAAQKNRRLLTLVNLLPRPMIIYVISPQEASLIMKTLYNEGFRNIEVFTGETDDTERERIIAGWENNQFDIVIATSAFGLGVDKPDVRTVIHACVPENPNRFYQELGRGGRDGLPSLSVVCINCEKDFDGGFSLIKSKVLTSEYLIGRIEGMINDSLFYSDGKKCFFNTNAPPSYKQDDLPTGKKNISWNLYTLLFLYRYDYIDLLDMYLDEETGAYIVEASVYDYSIISNNKEFKHEIARYRENEWNRIYGEFEMMKQLFSSPKERCWAQVFMETYPLAEEHCSGCPEHEAPYDSFQLDSALRKKVDLSQTQIEELPQELRKYLEVYHEMCISMDNRANSFAQVQVLLSKLFIAGVNIVVVPDEVVNRWEKFASNLSPHKTSTVFTYSEFDKLSRRNPYLIRGIVAIIYGQNQWDNINIYNSSTLNRGIVKIIHCGDPEMEVNSYSRKLKDLIDGYEISLEVFLKEEKGCLKTG